jgi:hypothetical protein
VFSHVLVGGLKRKATRLEVTDIFLRKGKVRWREGLDSQITMEDQILNVERLEFVLSHSNQTQHSSKRQGNVLGIPLLFSSGM